MQEEGTAAVNHTYLQNITAEVKAIGDDAADGACAAIQAVVTAAMEAINGWIAGIKAEIERLLPLSTVPHDLNSVITYLQHLAAPYIAAYNACIAALEQVIQDAQAFIAAVQEVVMRLLTCSITIPALIF